MSFLDKLLRRDKRAEQKRKDALAGRTTSGHLSQGERDRLFREGKARG